MASPVLKQRTYRLTNLPASCTKDEIRNSFPEAAEKLIERISLANARFGLKDSEKIATVTFAEEPSFLSKLCFKSGALLKNMNEKAKFSTVRIDSNFYGWTPLYADAEDKTLVDIIAVTGLGGKAFASWQCDDGSMWLRDHLPNDIPGIRVSVFGYSSDLANSNSRAILSDFTADFLINLENRRRMNSQERRLPLILLGHSIGGLIIKQAWIRCAQNHSLSYLHRAIHGLIFFGTPHDGMEASHLIQAMKGAPPENLVRDLAPDSTTIKSLMDEFSRSSSSSLKIVSCYECRETPTSIKQTDGSLKRNGKNALMVRQTSACLHWTNEKRIPIIENHSMIAKLPRRPGSAYEGVKDAIFELVNEAKVFIPRRLQRFSICECVRGITAASHTVQHAVPTIENLAPSLRSSLEKGLEKLCGICELLLHEKFSNFFLGDEVTPNSIHAIGSTISHLANIFQAYSTTTIFGEGLMQITESPMRALGSTRTWDFVVSDTITSAQDELYKQPAVFELVQSISRLVDDLLRILSPLMLRFFDSASVGALTSEGFAKQSGLAHMVMQQELFRSAQVLEPECPLPGTLEVEPNGVSSEDVIMGKYMSETEPLSQAVIVEYRPYVPPKTSDRPLTVQENALVESTKTNTRKLVALLRRFHSGLSNDSSLNTLQCLGFIDDQDKGRLAFLYAIPEAHLQLDGSASPHLMSLKQAIKNKKFNKLPLETRLDLAYRLCTSIANLHCSGWVHKNISSANILCAPRRGSTSYSKLPRWDLYLKGFETSREASAKSALTGEWDKNIIYRHPDRLEEDSVIKFTKKHDIYSLGLVLFELGSRSLIEKLYNNTTESLTPGHELTPEGWQDVIKRKATNTLPSSMGIFYTDAVTTCIEGKFEDAQDDDYQTELGLSFQRLVIRKLAAGVTLWPNSQI